MVKGFNERVVEAVEQMSNNKGLEYGEYNLDKESDVAKLWLSAVKVNSK